MIPVAWFAAVWALAGAPTLDRSAVCAATDPVALAPALQRRFGSCANVVPAQRVSDFLRAFALSPGELAEVEHADRLVRHLDARWLVIEAGEGHWLYDATAKDFVDPAVLSGAEAPDAEPKTAGQIAADGAYRKGYRALRAKQVDEARTELTTCLQHDPEHVGCHWELGWVHWVAEEWQAAAASWTHVEQRQPDYPELGVWLPKAKAKAGE